MKGECQMTYNYDGEDVTLNITQYTDGNTAVLINCTNGEPFGRLSVNTGVDLPENWIAVDTNNLPDAVDFIEDNNLGKHTGYSIPSGFCVYPVYELNIEKFNAE